MHQGIPVTTTPRTLLDLAAILPPHQLERAMNEAERQHLTDPLSLEALLHRYPMRAGRGALRQALERAQNGATITRSDGYAFHATRAAFEADRARDRRLQAAGWSVVRITWRQLDDEQYRLAAELKALLTARAGPAAALPAPSG